LIHARNFAASPHTRLQALVDPFPQARDAAAREFPGVALYPDYRPALADARVDAVVICAPTAQHREIVVAAAQAGKHALCEKPMAMNPAECEDMIRAATAAGVKLQIGFMRRFDAGFLEAWARVQAGDIGTVVQVKSITHGPSIPKPWMYDLRQSNGPLAEVNSHDIDTLRWFTGGEFRRVYAIGGNFRCMDARTAYPDFYDNVLLAAAFDNGMQGMIGGAQGVRYGYDARLEILGTEGIVCVGSMGGQRVLTYSARGAGQPFVKSWADLFADAYRAEDAAFAECIAEDRTPAVTGLDGKRAVEVVNAGNESIRTGQPVELKPEI
jgi:predicted dehydrogenase